MKVVCASGFFDPIHAGHIEYLQKAKKLGDKLVVILNNDAQAHLKKGLVLMPVEQRLSILRELACVDCVVIAFDEDGSVCKTLEHVRPHVFAKGGDRFVSEIPEKEVCDRLDIEIVDGLGGKTYSSRTVVREILKNVEHIPKDYINGK